MCFLPFSSQPCAYHISFQNRATKIIITQHKPHHDSQQIFEYVNPLILWFMIGLGFVSFVYLCYLLSSSCTTPHPHFTKHQFLRLLCGFLLHYMFDRYIHLKLIHVAFIQVQVISILQFTNLKLQTEKKKTQNKRNKNRLHTLILKSDFNHHSIQIIKHLYVQMATICTVVHHAGALFEQQHLMHGQLHLPEAPYHL